MECNEPGTALKPPTLSAPTLKKPCGQQAGIKTRNLLKIMMDTHFLTLQRAESLGHPQGRQIILVGLRLRAGMKMVIRFQSLARNRHLSLMGMRGYRRVRR